MKIKLSNIPPDFILEYNLLEYAKDSWVYFEIRKGVYGLPQAGIIAKKLLESRLNASGYYQAQTTPGLWRHKWRPILFCLVVDDFGIEYVGERHLAHLRSTLTQHYKITDDIRGEKIVGIDLKWDYIRRRCRLSMNGYLRNLLIALGHPSPTKQ